MYLSTSILMIDSQAGQVEDLISLPKMLFFHDKIGMTIKLSVMLSPEALKNKWCRNTQEYLR